MAQLDPTWAEKVYELDWECTQDEPLPDTPTKPSFAEYATTMFDSFQLSARSHALFLLFDRVLHC